MLHRYFFSIWGVTPSGTILDTSKVAKIWLQRGIPAGNGGLGVTGRSGDRRLGK